MGRYPKEEERKEYLMESNGRRTKRKVKTGNLKEEKSGGTKKEREKRKCGSGRITKGGKEGDIQKENDTKKNQKKGQGRGPKRVVEGGKQEIRERSRGGDEGDELKKIRGTEQRKRGRRTKGRDKAGDRKRIGWIIK